LYYTHIRLAINLLENVKRPASDCREKARRKVAGWVDGVAAVEAERHADGNHRQTHEQGDHTRGHSAILRVGDPANYHQQYRSADDLKILSSFRKHLATIFHVNLHIFL